jgi:membrane protease YdiL (CAAX protease family)
MSPARLRPARPPRAAGAALLLASAAVVAALAVGVPLSGSAAEAAPGHASGPGVSAGDAADGAWERLEGAVFDLVYRPDQTADPALLMGVLEEAAARAALFLDLPWPEPLDPSSAPSPAYSRTVFFLGPERALPSRLAGEEVVLVRGTGRRDLREAAVGSVLARAAGRPAGHRVSTAVTAGLTHYLEHLGDPGADGAPEGSLHPHAVARVLSERGRLASVPQVLRWWPSLPFGRDQLASLVGHVHDCWGAEGLVELALRRVEEFHHFGVLDSTCREALGVELATLDRSWTSAVAAPGGRLGSPPTEEHHRRAAAAVEEGLARTRLEVVGLALVTLTAGAGAACALGGSRRDMALALAPFAAAAFAELCLFTLPGLGIALKSATAMAEAAVLSALIVVWARRRRSAVSGPLAPDAPRPAGRQPRDAVRETLFVAALSAAVMAPRFGLYFYCREIWAKAPMIVLVVGLLLLAERRGTQEVGLGPMPAGRLALVAAAGLLAFRLTTGLTEALYHTAFSEVTGTSFAWHRWWPWWRAVGFEHYPLVPWPDWFPLVDITDFFFGNFAEELFFRGYLLWRLQRAMGWWPALAVQAFLFGVFHVNYDLFPFYLWPMVMYVLMATAFGVLMGLLLRWSGSLLVPALVHPLSNLGFLWVGVTWEGFRGGWYAFPLYYVLQVAIGLAVIPLVLRAATSWSDRRARRAADRRRAREGWVEVRH